MMYYADHCRSRSNFYFQEFSIRIRSGFWGILRTQRQAMDKNKFRSSVERRSRSNGFSMGWVSPAGQIVLQVTRCCWAPQFLMDRLM